MLTPCTSSSRKVTGITAMHFAGSIDVCRQGTKVALHIHTTDGIVLVHMDERAFVASCRGPRDANGNPLRTFADLDEDTRRTAEHAIDAKIEATKPTLGMGAETVAKCESAWNAYVTGDARSQGAAAKLVGVAAYTFSRWVGFNHAEEARRLRFERFSASRSRARTAPA